MSAVSAAMDTVPHCLFDAPGADLLAVDDDRAGSTFVRAAAVVVEFEDRVHPARSQRLSTVDFVAFAHLVSENGS